MARIMSRQTRLTAVFWTKSIPGLVLTIAGLGLILISTSQHPTDIKVAVIGLVIIGVGVSLVFRNKSFLIGAKGEKMVSNALAGFPEDWYVFNDVIVGDTQIDHILICPKGVYAIETKHYRGTISGKADAPDWWQFIQSRQTKMYNPIRQAFHHARALGKYLQGVGYNEIWVEPVVVFSHPEVKLDVTSPEASVIYLSQLKKLLDSRKQDMSPQECADISANLNTYIVWDTKKSRLLTRWLPISVFIIAIFVGVWWVISERPVTTEAPKESVTSQQDAPKTEAPKEIVISWQDASKYVGQIKTVQGKIIRTYSGDKAWEMNFDGNYKKTLTVVIFSKYFSNFPNGIDKYRDESVRLKGKIVSNEYENYSRPQIIIERPEQIEIGK
ncbi:MAG: NERD domain-containing protein [Planctomycetes bacterium]|nr:NERD domain-containing protein [Planctomycetota bacterium]